MKSLFANVDAGMIGLIFFFIVFLVVAVWLYLPKHKQEVEAHKFIPLDEDEGSRE